MKRVAVALLVSQPAAYSAFCVVSLAATAPLWRIWVFGFNPTLDQALRLAVCGGTVP